MWEAIPGEYKDMLRLFTKEQLIMLPTESWRWDEYQVAHERIHALYPWEMGRAVHQCTPPKIIERYSVFMVEHFLPIVRSPILECFTMNCQQLIIPTQETSKPICYFRTYAKIWLDICLFLGILAYAWDAGCAISCCQCFRSGLESFPCSNFQTRSVCIPDMAMSWRLSHHKELEYKV